MKIRKLSSVICIVMVFLLVTSVVVLAMDESVKLATFGTEPIDWIAREKSLTVEGEKPLPPSIQPVLFLSGNEYDMGYQYGYQGAAYMRAFIDHLWASWLSRDWCETVEDRDYFLKGMHYYVQKHAPFIIEFMEGMVKGMIDAGYPATYAEVLMMQCEWEEFDVMASSEPNYPSAPLDELPLNCSTFAAWGSTTVEEQTILAQSGDCEYHHQGTFVVFPENGNSYIAYGEIGVVVFDHNINSKGVCVGLTYSGSERPIDNQFGLPCPIALAKVARFADSATEAKDILLEIPVCWGMNFIIADSSGMGYVVEASSAHKAVRTVGDYGEEDFLVNTNFYKIPEMFDVSGKSSPPYSKDRYDLFFDFLQNNQGSVDLEFAKMMYRNTPVLRSSTRAVCIGVTDEESTVDYICTGPAYKVDKQRSFPIEPTYSFYEVNLKNTPGEVTEAAHKTSKTYLGEAITEFNKIDYDNPRYMLLNEILIESKTMYYEGVNYKRSAQVATGNEALFNYSKAMTAYTVAQALAKQVYNGLVTPAFNPADLN